jgi:hypothetical protein
MIPDDAGGWVQEVICFVLLDLYFAYGVMLWLYFTDNAQSM